MKTNKKGKRLRIPYFGWIVIASWLLLLLVGGRTKDLGDQEREIIVGVTFIPALISTFFWAIRYCSQCSTFVGFDEQGKSNSTYERCTVNKEFSIRNKKGEKIGGYDLPTPAITHSWTEIKACRHCGALVRESKSETRTKY